MRRPLFAIGILMLIAVYGGAHAQTTTEPILDRRRSNSRKRVGYCRNARL